MTKIVAGLFPSVEEADAVVNDLTSNGFDKNDISLVTPDKRKDRHEFIENSIIDPATKEEVEQEDTSKGIVGGGILGGALGLLVGVGLLAIPGIGPLVVAGPIAAAMGATLGGGIMGTAVGATFGTAAGGLIGTLVGAGATELEARRYADGVEHGKTLIIVHAGDTMADVAYKIISQHGGEDVKEREE